MDATTVVKKTIVGGGMAMVGATVGTVMLPGIGTVLGYGLGTVLGAVAGAFAGSALVTTPST